MEAPKASRLVLYTDLGERPDPAMEAPDRPSKVGNKHRSHRSTLGTGEGKRGGARREATFTCVCSRRSRCVLGAPLGPTRATAQLCRGEHSARSTAPPCLGAAPAPPRLRARGPPGRGITWPPRWGPALAAAVRDEGE